MKIYKSDISLFITAIVIVSFVIGVMRNQEKEQEVQIRGGVIRLGISSFGSSKIQNTLTGLQDMKLPGIGFQGNNSSLHGNLYNTYNNSQGVSIR